MNQRFGQVALALILLISPLAQANFASNPDRKTTPEFVRFFMKRFDPWFRKNVFDFEKDLSAKERALVEQYRAKMTAFGVKTPAGFVRTLSYGVRIENDSVVAGPFRFVDPTSGMGLNEQMIAVLKDRKVTLEDPSTLRGVGFAGKFIEAIVMTKSGWSIRRYRDGKIEQTSDIALSIQGEHCPPSGATVQIDRATADSKKISVVCHTSLFEDQALLPIGRKLAIKIRRELNLIPGVVEWESAKSYGLFYP